MPTLLAIIALGLSLGIRHATDPDHVVAVTTIVSRERTIFHAAMVGALWGLGHTVTILAIGSAIIVLNLTIPPAVGLTMELSVGCMLILLGILNLTGLMHRLMNRVGDHGAHSHLIAGRLKTRTHPAPSEMNFRRDGSIFSRAGESCKKLGLFHALRPVAVGIVHGLAGSAAVALLVLATVNRSGWAIGYLLVFGLGTIVGMMLITAAIALPFTFTLRHFAHWNKTLGAASGAISLSFGLFLCYHIGISSGLLTGHPTWIPH
jgi:high-affinity nickel-transport protein